jgi:uncharacterized repeat protein (TIGR04052 family)
MLIHSRSWVLAAIPSSALALLFGCGDSSATGASAASTEASTSSSTGASGGGAGEGGHGGGGGAAPVAVSLSFEARVGDKVFDCASSYPGLGTAATEVSIADFRMYVHDVRLVTADHADVPVKLDESVWQYQGVALLDFEDKTGACSNGTVERNTKVTGTVPPGTYTGLKLKLGVPPALNHADAASAHSPLNLTGLFWTWRAGYKFVRLDAAAVGGVGPFLVHLGSNGCKGDPSLGEAVTCSRPNVAEIDLNGFDPTKKTILVDYAELVKGSDLGVNVSGAQGCQSDSDDPECPPLFERLGLAIIDGSPTPDTQKFFRSE